MNNMDMNIRQIALQYRASNRKEVYRLMEDISRLRMNVNEYNKALEEMNDMIIFHRERNYYRRWCYKGKNINFDVKFLERLSELKNKVLSNFDEEYMTCDETKNDFIKILDEIYNELLEMELIPMDEDDLKYI